MVVGGYLVQLAIMMVFAFDSYSSHIFKKEKPLF